MEDDPWKVRKSDSTLSPHLHVGGTAKVSPNMIVSAQRGCHGLNCVGLVYMTVAPGIDIRMHILIQRSSRPADP